MLQGGTLVANRIDPVGNDFRLQLKFWGVRGSTPAPATETVSFGGNTPCLEVRLPNGEIFIFDGGTGIRNLGIALNEEFKNRKLFLNLFLTHYHWDHIQGIPFFEPLYRSENEINFYASHNSGNLEEFLKGQMKYPYFPVNFELLPAKKNYIEIDAQPMKVGNLLVQPFNLNHPQGCLGFRIEYQGAVIVYATDLEHGNPKLDSVVRDYCRGANIVICDAQYTQEEYERHKGWGHTTWLEATRIAQDAKAEQLLLFHHEPVHNDGVLLDVEKKARLRFENTQGAKEGSIFIL